jgi:hypothetical protein
MNQTQTVIISAEPPPKQSGGFGRLFFAGALGVGAVMVLAGLQRVHQDPAELLRSTLKALERSTLKQVRKADENSCERDKALDKNHNLRLKKLSAEVIGESRANFDVLSGQVHCLTQIALQTLTNLAKPTGETPGGDNASMELEKERHKILKWCRRAQEEADKLVDPENVRTARHYHVESMKAEVPGLITEGGVDVKDGAIISAGPHVLPEFRNQKMKKEDRGYSRLGLGCLGCTVLLGSMYLISSPNTESRPR